MIIKKKNNAFWGIFSYLFLQKLKGDRNDESCAINEFFCLPLRLKNANCSFLLSTKERKFTQCRILSFFFFKLFCSQLLIFEIEFSLLKDTCLVSAFQFAEERTLIF